MIIAVEDGLSEAVTRKIMATVRPDVRIDTVIGNRGKSYLKKRASELNRAAAGVPILLLTDQDLPHPCPPELRLAWFGAHPPNLLFRVAVMEVESWILADRTSVAALLGVPDHRIPTDTDQIAQPKEFLVNLARRSRLRGIRQDFVPATGSTAVVGTAYNTRLSHFVAESWMPVVAAKCSPSLARCVHRLREAFR